MNPYEHQSGMGYGYQQPGQRPWEDRPYERQQDDWRQPRHSMPGGRQQQDWGREDGGYGSQNSRRYADGDGRQQQWQGNSGQSYGQSGQYGYDGGQRGSQGQSSMYGSSGSQSQRPGNWRPGYDPREYDRMMYEDQEGRYGEHYAYPGSRDDYGYANTSQRGQGRDRSPYALPPMQQPGYDSYGSQRSQNSGYAGQGYGSSSSRGEGYGYGSGYSGYSSGWGGASSGSERRGKAPKNFKRSDDRLKEIVSDTLISQGCDCSEMEVEVKDGVVTLTGEVEDRREKLEFERLASDIGGVEDVENKLRVRPRDKGDQHWESKTTSRAGYSTGQQQSSNKGSQSQNAKTIGQSSNL